METLLLFSWMLWNWISPAHRSLPSLLPIHRDAGCILDVYFWIFGSQKGGVFFSCHKRSLFSLRMRLPKLMPPDMPISPFLCLLLLDVLCFQYFFSQRLQQKTVLLSVLSQTRTSWPHSLHGKARMIDTPLGGSGCLISFAFRLCLLQHL